MLGKYYPIIPTKIVYNEGLSMSSIVRAVLLCPFDIYFSCRMRYKSSHTGWEENETVRRVPFMRDVYVISDEASVLIKAVEDGAAVVQLRDKASSDEIIAEKAREILAFKSGRPFLFILNDNPVLALKVGADGVHIGQDMSTTETRALIGDEMILGKTTHNLEQARSAGLEGADYVSVGPVWATPTKPGRPAVGLAYVREAAARLNLPFVAIGGIDLSNIDEVLAAGATTVGIVRAYRDTASLLKWIRGKS